LIRKQYGEKMKKKKKDMNMVLEKMDNYIVSLDFINTQLFKGSDGIEICIDHGAAELMGFLMKEMRSECNKMQQIVDNIDINK